VPTLADIEHGKAPLPPVVGRGREAVRPWVLWACAVPLMAVWIWIWLMAKANAWLIVRACGCTH
jgi:hypothetical protein